MSNTEDNTKNTPDEIKRIQFYLRKELDKWDRTELDLKNGGVADFMAIDHILEVLPPVVQALITAARINENQKHLNKIVAWQTRKPVPGELTSASFGSAGAAMETSGWKHAFEDRIATLTNDKIEGEHGGLERRSDGSE